MTIVAAGIDVGGTKVSGALVTVDGTVRHHLSVQTPRTDDGADPSGEATARVIGELLATAAADGHDLCSVGIGVPEYVDPHGKITSSLVLAWDAEPIRLPPIARTLRDTHLAVAVESDVRCAAIAESHVGHGHGVTSCLFVSIGTGISHTLVIDGRPWAGCRGEAIAMGELPVSSDDLLLDDAPATVEAQASGRALEEVAARLHPDTGDDLEQSRRRAGRIVARAVADVVKLTDPEIVVLGGGLGTSTGGFALAFDEHYHTSLGERPDAPPLQRSATGALAGTIGAGLVAHDLSGAGR